jgi:hypothetical protein
MVRDAIELARGATLARRADMQAITYFARAIGSGSGFAVAVRGCQP